MDWRPRISYGRLGQRLLFTLFALAVMGGLLIEALRNAAPVPAPIYHRRTNRGKRPIPSELNCDRLAAWPCADGN